MIKKVGKQYILYTKDGKRILGRHPSMAKAIAQEWAIKKAKGKK